MDVDRERPARSRVRANDRDGAIRRRAGSRVGERVDQDLSGADDVGPHVQVVRDLEAHALVVLETRWLGLPTPPPGTATRTGSAASRSQLARLASGESCRSSTSLRGAALARAGRSAIPRGSAAALEPSIAASKPAPQGDSQRRCAARAPLPRAGFAAAPAAVRVARRAMPSNDAAAPQPPPRGRRSDATRSFNSASRRVHHVAFARRSGDQRAAPRGDAKPRRPTRASTPTRIVAQNSRRSERDERCAAPARRAAKQRQHEDDGVARPASAAVTGAPSVANRRVTRLRPPRWIGTTQPEGAAAVFSHAPPRRARVASARAPPRPSRAAGRTRRTRRAARPSRPPAGGVLCEAARSSSGRCRPVPARQPPASPLGDLRLPSDARCTWNRGNSCCRDASGVTASETVADADAT